MKVIFLDHDGVICLANNWGGRHKKTREYVRKHGHTKDYPVDLRFDDFDKKSIGVLNSILEITDAEIIISSDWRYHATLEEMGEYYTSQGIIKKPYGYTPRSTDIPLEEGWEDLYPSMSLESERASEIRYTLATIQSIKKWVAIDDLQMGNKLYDWGLSNFVHTPKSREGIKQSGIKEKILKYLI